MDHMIKTAQCSSLVMLQSGNAVDGGGAAQIRLHG